MKNSNVLRRFVQGALVLVLLLGIVAAFVFGLDAQKPLASAISAPATNASAEQDLRMVMQELERERLEPLNANSSMASLCMTNTTAEQDMRMVMLEYGCERSELLNANSFAEQLPARNAAAQDLRMVTQELARERLDQLNVNLLSQQFSAVRAVGEASIACLEPRPSCDR